MTKRYKAYIASPLTGLENNERTTVYAQLNKIKEICYKNGIEPYLPGQFTDPVINSEITPYTVYQTDRDRVRSSDLFVLLAIKPSFGAGQEVEIAYNSLIPMIILYPKTTSLSRMVLGIPGRLKYESSFEDDTLEAKFIEGLKVLMPHIERRHINLDLAQKKTVGETIKSLREERNMSLDDLSSEIGIATEELEFIERSNDQANNLSMIIASKLAEVLNVDPEKILFSDFYNRKIAEWIPKFISVLEKSASTEIIGARTKEHPIDHSDINTILMTLILESKW